MMDGMMSFGYGGFGFLWMFLFWGGLIFLTIWLISRLFPSSKIAKDSDERQPAEEILKQRYAKGEISQEQYQTMRHTLES